MNPFDANAEAQLGALALKRKDAVTAVRSFKSVLGSNPPDRAQAHTNVAEAPLAAGSGSEETDAGCARWPYSSKRQDLSENLGYGQVAPGSEFLVPEHQGSRYAVHGSRFWVGPGFLSTAPFSASACSA